MGTVQELMFSPRLPNFPKTILLRDLNEFITCSICGGYLIDATTVTECLHTFCKSCIVKHLEEENTCPNCESQIHHSYPLNYIAHDRTMQDIVYKLVPRLLEEELERERVFYEERGLPNPKDEVEEEEEEEEAEERGKEEEEEEKGEKASTHHREDEQVNLRLEPRDEAGRRDYAGKRVDGVRDDAGKDEGKKDEDADEDDKDKDKEKDNEKDKKEPDGGKDKENDEIRPLKKKFIRVSTQATITHLKKFLALKMWDDASRFKELDVTCNGVLCGKDYTLKFVVKSNWKSDEDPVLLQYGHRLHYL